MAVAVLISVYVLDSGRRIAEDHAAFLYARITVKNLLLLVAFTLLWRTLSTLLGLFRWSQVRDRAEESIRVAAATAVASLSGIIIPLTSVSHSFNYTMLAYFWMAVTPAVLLVRFAARRVATAPYARATRDVIIIGSGPRGQRLMADLCAATSEAYNVIGLVDSQGGIDRLDGTPHLLGALDQLGEILMRRPVDRVLIALPIKSCYAQIQHAIEVCERLGVEAAYPLDVFDSVTAAQFDDREEVPLLSHRYCFEDDHRLVLKRVVDLVVSVIGLLALAPLLALIAVAVKLTSAGPVLFASERYGLRKRRFRMYKFRTMVVNAEDLQGSLEFRNEAVGPIFKIKADPRITPLGRFLRVSSLDELPQLLNVALGDMSLIGPRPLPVRDVLRFQEPWLTRRFSMRPGMTGLCQVSGRSALSFDDWMRLDLSYIDHWSPSLDLRILWRTIPAVLTGTGAS